MESWRTASLQSTNTFGRCSAETPRHPSEKPTARIPRWTQRSTRNPSGKAWRQKNWEVAMVLEDSKEVRYVPASEETNNNKIRRPTWRWSSKGCLDYLQPGICTETREFSCDSQRSAWANPEMLLVANLAWFLWSLRAQPVFCLSISNDLDDIL